MFHVKHKGDKVNFCKLDVSELFRIFKEVGIQLSDYQLNQFKQFYHEIISWNCRVNLISKNDETRIIERHFLESSAFSFFEELKGPVSVLDLGSGGGFPGVPLKIINPDIELMLLDSKRMKALFLNSLIKTLNLNNAEVLCKRAEDAGEMTEFKNKFDVVVSRAVAELPVLYNWARAFLKPGGLLAATKGSKLAEEVKVFALKWPQAQIEINSMPFRVSDRTRNQKIVFVRK